MDKQCNFCHLVKGHEGSCLLATISDYGQIPTISRINMDGPCKRCGKETFKRACSDPDCHIAYLDGELEKMDQAVLDRDCKLAQAREALRLADNAEWINLDGCTECLSDIIPEWEANPAVIAAKETEEKP